MTAPLDEKAEHPRIWLEPAGAPDRCWCSDNQWGDEGVEYILASEALSAVALPDELEVVARATRFDWNNRAQLSLAEVDGNAYALPNGTHDLVTISQAHSTIATLRAETERLTAELTNCGSALAQEVEDRITAEAQVKRLTEEKEALRKALEPFADIDQPEHEHLPDETPVAVQHETLLDLTLILGHFRRARAALNIGEKAE